MDSTSTGPNHGRSLAEQAAALFGPGEHGLSGTLAALAQTLTARVSTFKYKLSENAREYLFEQIFIGAAASKFNTVQMTEIIYNLSMPNSPAWPKKATEFMAHLSSLKDEDQQTYSLTWHRYTEPKMVFEFFKNINIKEYLTPLNAYSQARVIEKIFELKNVKEASNLLKKLSHEINEFLPKMDPSVQKIFIREAFDLPNTETGAKIAAEGLLNKICELLPDMNPTVLQYLENNNYFITSPNLNISPSKKKTCCRALL